VSFRRKNLTLALLGVLLLSDGAARAQGPVEQPTPFSVWLDFQGLTQGVKRKAGLPIWIENVERIRANQAATTFRIRLRRLGPLSDELQLRLFFRDHPAAAPNVTGWTETGAQPYESGPLGDGLDVQTSASLLVPAADLDYLDVDVPGDGLNLRGAYLTSLRKDATRRALDFAPAPELLDPFGAPAPAQPGEDDSLLHGRVRATIDTAPLKLTPPGSIDAIYQFALDAQPIVASATFEVLGANLLEPLSVYLNGHFVGPLHVAFPDLADPGFVGIAAPLERDLRLRYTGWLRGQVMLPASRLAAGPNTLVLRASPDHAPVVLRAVEIQLKHPSAVFDYELKP
jgi:hypothetical protein